MALLASWGGVLRLVGAYAHARERNMASASYPVCSPRSAIAHPSSVFSSRPLPAFSLSATRPQAVPLSRVLSQMRLISPAPYSRRTAALTLSAPLREGVTKHWPNEQRRNVRCTQELRLDPAAAGAPRLRPEASPPQKKFARRCSSSVSGIVGNHNAYLAPGFTLEDLVPAAAKVAVFRGLLELGFNGLYQMSFQQWDRFYPCGPSTSRTPLRSWGFALPSRAPPGRELRSCSLCTPLVYSLNGSETLSFRLSPFLVQSLRLFPIFHFLSSCFWGGAFFPYSPPPNLCPLSACKSTSLPAASRSPSSPLRAASLLNSVIQVVQIFVLNPPISFLGVQDALVLVWLYFMDTRHTKNFHLGSSSAFSL
uniref:E3 ubiquitin-protein ligase parkin isoform X1 n=1 Tax=Panthera onca TaxID=9690 RepID=UPI002954BAF1|nr:E3 ubiquitin-protein ligase parkin isoform X1 [Panthera onca]